MPRDLIAGMTDYSHQNLNDILTDLSDWITSLTNVHQFIYTTIQQLKESGYWDKVPIEMKDLVTYAMKFYDTSTKEMAEIREELQTEVQHNHILRLNRLAETAHNLNRSFGRIWHNEYNPKEYGNPNFALVEKIYSRGRDMVVDMLDIGNIVTRLKDYVGKRSNIPHQGHSSIEHPNISVLIRRMDDTLARDDYAGVLHASASIFETLAKEVVRIPSVQNQTLKAFFERYRQDSTLPDPILDYILSVYDRRNKMPLAGHGSTQTPTITKEEAVALTEMTKAFVRIEYMLQGTNSS